MRFALAAMSVLSIVACAAPAPSAKGAGAKKTELASNAGGPNAKGKYVCTYEEDVGSHMRQKICRYIDDQGDARGRQQDDMREMGTHAIGLPALPASKGGGH
jgi:hypothetical protein